MSALTPSLDCASRIPLTIAPPALCCYLPIVTSAQP